MLAARLGPSRLVALGTGLSFLVFVDRRATGRDGARTDLGTRTVLSR